MGEENTETTVDRKLTEIFEEAFDLNSSFETCNDPTNSSEFQAKIKKCMRLFEDCTRLVSVCGLFSSNESYTELPTSDLKYLLLPFFLGNLSQKLCGGSRAEIVQVSEVYFKDFLARCADYEVYEPNPNSSVVKSSSTDNSDEKAALTAMVHERNHKLEKYRQKKELEDEIKKIKIVMNQDRVDEEVQRDFYIKLLKLSVIDAQEELNMIEQERKILEFQRDHPEQASQKAPRRPVQPLKPIIITKDLAQKAIYGLGYPSLPTMTVSEFYDQRVRDGIFPDPKAAKNQNSLQDRAMGNDTAQIEEQQDVEQELKLEADDDYELARARAKDNYKDDHRRGEGNRYNRS